MLKIRKSKMTMSRDCKNHMIYSRYMSHETIWHLKVGIRNKNMQVLPSRVTFLGQGLKKRCRTRS
jgi:hypothetical protein